MKQPEGWRSNRSMGVPTAAYQTPFTAANSTAGQTDASVSHSHSVLRALGRRLFHLASDIKAVQWSIALLGVLGYIFATTTYRLPIGAPSALLALIGVLLLPQGPRLTTPTVLMFAFVAWAGVSVAFSPWPSVAAEVLWELLKVSLIFFAMTNALRTRSQAWVFVVFFLLCFATHAARGALINYVSGGTFFGRASWYVGVYTNPNDLAALTILQLSMAVSLAATQRWGIVKMGGLAATAVLPFVVLITQSRAGFLGMSVFALLALLGSRYRIRGAILLGVMAVGLVAVSPSGVWERLKGLRNVSIENGMAGVDEEGSAEQRFELLRTGLRVAARNPVTGTGVGTVAYANGSVTEALRGRDSHNTYVSVVAETGLPGLLLFLALVASVLAYSRNSQRLCRKLLPDGVAQLRYLELGLIAFLLVSFFGSYSKLAFWYVHLALVVAFASTLRREYVLLTRAQFVSRGPGSEV